MPQSSQKLVVEVPAFRPDGTLGFTWQRPPRLAIGHDGLTVSISGDPASLSALAVALLALASEQVPDGMELAADSWLGMTGDVPHLVLRRDAGGS